MTLTALVPVPSKASPFRLDRHRSWRLFAVFGLALTGAGPKTTWSADARTAAVDLGLPVQNAAAAGFSKERLKRVEALLRQETEANRYASAVWLVARDGRVVSHGAVGFRNLERREPMTEDTVFKIYSMTKIITSVTVLSLMEEGRFNLDDNISRYLPPLGKMQVLTGGTIDAPQLVDAKRPITIRQLLTHTSGFGYDLLGRDPVQCGIYLRADLWKSTSSRDFVARAAKLPLKHQPGEGWTYGINTDLLGALAEALTGQPLETVMRERVFGPLGMNETTFRPSAALKARLGTIYRRNPAGGLKPEIPFGIDLDERADPFASGGGGLVSTLHDYA